MRSNFMGIALLLCGIISLGCVNPALARRSAYLQHTAQAIHGQLNEAEVRLINDTLHVLFPRNLMFDQNEAGIRADFVPVMKRLSLVLEQYPHTEILLVGHSDSQGSDVYNLELSRRRADSAKAILMGFGITAARLNAWGLGSSLPLAPNGTETGRGRNRRVEFIVLYNYRNEPSDL